MVGKIELKNQKYHCGCSQRIAADGLFSKNWNRLAGMVCADPIVIRIKATIVRGRLPNRVYCRIVPLSHFTVLARTGHANLRFPSVVSVDNDIASLFCSAGTFRGSIFNDYQLSGR